jgi:hypothetical protein
VTYGSELAIVSGGLAVILRGIVRYFIVLEESIFEKNLGEQETETNFV